MSVLLTYQTLDLCEERLQMSRVCRQIPLSDPRGGTGIEQGASLCCLHSHGHIVAESEERTNHHRANLSLNHLDLPPSEGPHSRDHRVLRLFCIYREERRPQLGKGMSIPGLRHVGRQIGPQPLHRPWRREHRRPVKEQCTREQKEWHCEQEGEPFHFCIGISFKQRNITAERWSHIMVFEKPASAR